MGNNLKIQKMSLLRGGDIFLFLIVLYIPIFYLMQKTGADLKHFSVFHFDSLIINVAIENDTSFLVNGVNIKIVDGKSEVTSSSCPSQICVYSSAIKKSGEQIICVPNGVVIEAVGGDGGVDAISQ